MRESFDLLSMSKVVHLIKKCKGNGVPLDADVVAKSYKALFLDIGLMNHLCGLQLIKPDEIITTYEGGLAEQFIGQELLNLGHSFEENQLCYWIREEKNTNAEIDYLISHGDIVVPVEVKAGKTGRLKSLHLFLDEKKRWFGVRFNIDPPSLANLKAKVNYGKRSGMLDYVLLSLPLYLAGQLNRLMEEALS